MAGNTEDSKESFIQPLGRYRGKFTPENLAFDANLQEFAHRVSILCSLETGGKLSAEAAYDEIKGLWKKLEVSKKTLLDNPPSPRPELPEE